MAGCPDALSIGRYVGPCVQPFQGELQRGNVGAAAGDYDDIGFAHNTPLVLGNSTPSRRIACRRLRPTPLKHDSIIWCVFSPRTLTCSAAPRLSAKERKKCGTSSVGISPTRSRLKRPSQTKW